MMTTRSVEIWVGRLISRTYRDKFPRIGLVIPRWVQRVSFLSLYIDFFRLIQRPQCETFLYRCSDTHNGVRRLRAQEDHPFIPITPIVSAFAQTQQNFNFHFLYPYPPPSTPISFPLGAPPPLSTQKSHTYAKTPQTTTKKTTHTRHPTPVVSAMRSIRPIVPLSRSCVFEKLSLRVSAREVEVRISWPIEMVICGEGGNERGMGGRRGGEKGK